MDNMQEFRLINGDEVRRILTMDSVISAVEKAYSLKVMGQAELFPIVCHEFKGEDSEFDIKSGSMDGAGVFGMKLVSAFYDNDRYGLPRLMGTILIFDRRTGALKAMMDGTLITNMRTGAAGAVGVKYLSREDSEDLVLVGTGAQALPLLRATLCVRPGIKRISVINIHTPGRAEAFISEVSGEFSGIDFVAGSSMKDLEDAVRGTDIVITATPSKEALIKASWVKPGTHFSCIGSDMEGKQELDIELVARSRAFCDDRTQVVSVGECEKAVKAGLLKAEDITEIGDVIIGRETGRSDDQEITLFDSTGIGLQDLMTASAVSDICDERNIGMMLKI